jgi:hypothetical protein
LRQRIKYKTGLDVGYGNTGRESYITCEADLTDKQKEQIAKIMADRDHVFGPDPAMVLPGNTIIVRDIFNYRPWLEKHWGVSCEIYNRQTGKFRGTGEWNEIIVVPCTDDHQFKRKLSKDELKAFLKAYTNLARVE